MYPHFCQEINFKRRIGKTDIVLILNGDRIKK